MDRNRETEARRQFAFPDVDPIFAGIITAIYAAVVLLKQHIRVGRMHYHFMNTLPELRVIVSHKICAHVLVVW
jgi:hypothetical protein